MLEEDVEDQLVAEMRSRGPQRNVSTFAFTATPKEKTLELFGRKGYDGKYRPFSLYSMRQAIEEGFILDVLQNYTTYQTYWKLLKTADDDRVITMQSAAPFIGRKAEDHATEYSAHIGSAPRPAESLGQRSAPDVAAPGAGRPRAG